MARFQVIVLGVQGINNKIYGPNDIVTEAHFPEGNALKLEKEGRLKRITSKKEDAEEAKGAKAKKLEALQAEIDKTKEVFFNAQKALIEAPEEADTAELQKAVEEAELALEIANENFKKA